MTGRAAPSPHVVAASIDDEVVLYDPRRHQAHLLNLSAAAVWAALVRDVQGDAQGDAAPPGASRERTAARLATAVAPSFGLAPQDLEDDIAQILDEFDGLELLDRPDEPSAPARPDGPTLAAEAGEIHPAHITSSPGPPDDLRFRTACFRALDLSFAVATDVEELVPYLDGILGPLRHADPPSLWYSVRRAMPPGPGAEPDLPDLELRIGTDEPHTTRLSFVRALSRLLWDYNHRAITTASSTVLLHASAVATAAGVIAFPAPAESGKSTLVTALVDAGYGYVTDECTAIDVEPIDRPSGRGRPRPTVSTYPKPIGLDPGSWDLFAHLVTPDPWQPDKRWLAGSRIGDGALAPHPDAAARIPLTAIVFPRYQSGAHSVLVPVSPARAVVQLARNSFRLAEQPERNLAALVALSRSVPAFDLAVDDLDAARTVIASLVETLPPPPDEHPTHG